MSDAQLSLEYTVRIRCLNRHCDFDYIFPEGHWKSVLNGQQYLVAGCYSGLPLSALNLLHEGKCPKCGVEHRDE
jgi:hypothetical protein